MKASSDNDHSLISMILPSGILENFDIVSTECTSEKVVVTLQEKIILPEGYTHDTVKLHGTLPGETIQDFPLRNKSLYLRIIRRRWLIKATNKTITRDLSFIAHQSRLSQEFATFLKGIHR